MLGAVKLEAISPGASILKVEMPILTHIGGDFTIGGSQHWGRVAQVMVSTSNNGGVGGKGAPLRVGGIITVAGASGSIIGAVNICSIAAVGYSLGAGMTSSISSSDTGSNSYAIVIESAGTVDKVELNSCSTALFPSSNAASSSATFDSFVVHGGMKVGTAASSGRGARVGLVQLWHVLQIYGALDCPWQGASGSTGIVIVNDVLVQEPQPAGACNTHGMYFLKASSERDVHAAYTKSCQQHPS